MYCSIVAVGEKMPKWCTLACEDYLQRLRYLMKCTMVEIPAATRHKAGVVAHYKEEEGRKICEKISADDEFIALDVKGQNWNSLQLSQRISRWQQQGKNLVFAIGGPDGLSENCLARANQRWSLSTLIFPHAMARVILVEQLYRALSILNHHPYHRE